MSDCVPLALPEAFLVTAPPMMVRAQDRQTKQERAIAEIRKRGGQVEMDTKNPGRPVVVAVDLKHTRVIDASLEHLKGLTSLETLNLENAVGVSDLRFVHLKDLAKLRKLDLEGTRVTGAGLQNLQKALPKVSIIH